MIKETNNYKLEIGASANKDVQGEVYKIINKKYNIVELESTMLPQAIKYLHDLEAGLAAVEDMYEVPKENAIIPLYQGKSKVN